MSFSCFSLLFVVQEIERERNKILIICKITGWATLASNRTNLYNSICFSAIQTNFAFEEECRERERGERKREREREREIERERERERATERGGAAPR